MNAPRTLALQGDFTIPAAAQWRERLLESVNGGDADLALDMQAVEAIDSAGIQLLLATRASLRARGAQLHLQQPSEPVRAALGTFGLLWLADGSTPGAEA